MNSRVQPPFITEEMSNLHVICDACGRTTQPDFWSRHKDPFIPIKSTHLPEGGGAWHQVSVGLTCECGQKKQLPVPWKTLKHSISHFGDEAYREVGQYFIAVYTLLGASSGHEREIGLALKDAKKSAAPTLDPDSWRIHVTEMNNGRKRLQHAHYKHLGRDDVGQLLQNCSRIISGMDAFAWKTCIVAVYQLGNHAKREHKRIRSYLERGMILGILGETIFRSTSQELCPQFFFDAQSVAAIARGTEGWAEEAYLGSRHYLGHLFITHSNDIPPPRFVQPGSHPFLELADVHAYTVARTIERKIRKQPPEVGLERFGQFRYLHFTGDRIDYEVTNSVPDKFVWRQQAAATA